MQELIPERLFFGGVQLIVINVEHSPRQLDLTHQLQGSGHGQHQPGAPLRLVQRHISGRAQHLLRAFGKLPRAHLPVSNPFFWHG